LISLRATAIAIVLILLVQLAEAQDSTPAPTRQLFGSDSRDPNRRQKADFSMFFNVTNDNGSQLSTASQLQQLDRWGMRQGAYSAVEGVLSYRTKHRRIVVDADTRSTFQYHPRLNDTISDYGARVALQIPVRRRTELSASQNVTYFQSYALPTLSEQPVGFGGFSQMSESRHAVSSVTGFTSTTNLRVTERLTRRSSIDIDYDLQSTQFTGDEADLRAWGARGRFTRRMTRSAMLHVGYGQRLGRYSASRPGDAVRIHDLDLGVDYRRSLSRSTTVSVTPGSSIVAGSDGRQYRLTGDVLARHRFGRRWEATALYRRSSQFVEGFADPFFIDSATAHIAGHLGRRFEVFTSASYSVGDIWSVSRATYDSYSGSARARYALNRHSAISLEYLYYKHRFAGEIAIPAAAAVNRHSLRVGLLWWRPVR
jgi:hypothetical protein